MHDRIQDLVAGLAILSAELHSLQRQQSALRLLLCAAEDRIKGVFSDEVHAQDALKQLQQFATTSHREIKELLQLRTQLRVTQPAQQQASGTSDEEEASEDESLASSCEASLKPDAGQEIDHGAEALMQITAGSAAVNMARAEHARAVKLDAQVERLLTERADLLSQIAALKSGSGVHMATAELTAVSSVTLVCSPSCGSDFRVSRKRRDRPVIPMEHGAVSSGEG